MISTPRGGSATQAAPKTYHQCVLAGWTLLPQLEAASTWTLLPQLEAAGWTLLPQLEADNGCPVAALMVTPPPSTAAATTTAQISFRRP